MQLRSNAVYLFILIFGFVASWCLLIPNIPFVGFWVFFTGLSCLVYYFKKPKYRFDMVLLALCLVLSAFFLVRANGLVLFLNFVTIVFLGSLLTLNRTNHLSIMKLLFAPVAIFLRALSTRNTIQLNTKNLKQDAANLIPKFDITKLGLSIGLTIILLIVIIPLLASANPIFGNMIDGIIKALDLTKLIEAIFTTNAIWNIARFIFAIVLFGFTTKLVSHVSTEEHIQPAQSVHTDTRIWLIPKLVLGLVLAAFFVTQIQLYTATAETLKALDYTNSQMTREVFGQLSFVSFIIFVMLFYDRNRSKFSQIITYFLIVESIFLIGVGFKSVFDYSSAWGFTYKRLYGFTFVFWLLAAFGLFSYKYIKRVADSTFLKCVVVLTGITLICINALNFDYLIYHVNPSHTGEGIHYLSLSELSPDARSYKEQLERIKSINNSEQEQTILGNLIDKVRYLQFKYNHLDIRSFNLNEYLEYLNVKDIKLDSYQKLQHQAYVQSGCTGYKDLNQALQKADSTCWLDLSTQNLTEFPMDILKLKNLRSLTLYGNQMAVIPEEISQLTLLEQLDVRQNKLTKLPEALGGMTHLNWIAFDNNAISQIPPKIFLLTNLTDIYGGDNNISSLPPEIGKASMLLSLNLQNNKLTALPEEMGDMTRLRLLYLDGNSIQKFPGPIDNWNSIEIISAYHNKLPPAEVERIQKIFSHLGQGQLELWGQE